MNFKFPVKIAKRMESKEHNTFVFSEISTFKDILKLFESSNSPIEKQQITLNHDSPKSHLQFFRLFKAIIAEIVDQ